jgi:hypothetical protein
MFEGTESAAAVFEKPNQTTLLSENLRLPDKPTGLLHRPTQMPEGLCDPARFFPKNLQSSVYLPLPLQPSVFSLNT